MMGVCVALRGPEAGRKRAGLSSGAWMKVAVPGGWRRVRGPVAMVQRVAVLRGPGRRPEVRLLVRCFCRASLV